MNQDHPLRTVQRVKLGGADWEVDPAFALHLETVWAGPRRVIKESPAKLVACTQVEGRTFYLKVYRHQSHWLRPWKYYGKRSPARVEWDLAWQLLNRAIPTVRHVALGERWGLRGLLESVLITEEFPGQTVTAQTAEEGAAVVAFVEHMHEKGVIQRDLHGANLLRDPGTGEVRLVDLYGCEVRDHLTRATRDHNLATLRMTLPIPVSASVAAQSRRLRKKALAHRSKRVWKHNREFEPRRLGGLWWQIRGPDVQGRVLSVLDDPDGFLERARPLKQGRSATVSAGDGLVLKRYNFKKPLNLLKDLFRPSRARQALRKAYHLELAGVPTARPLAAATRRRWGVATGGYFLMEEIAGAADVRQWQGDARRIARAAGMLLGRLHEEGFSHRDLKISNLMFDQAGAPRLIDLEGLRFMGELPPGRARADLARLWRSVQTEWPTGRRWIGTFMRWYCRERGLRPRELVRESSPQASVSRESGECVGRHL